MAEWAYFGLERTNLGPERGRGGANFVPQRTDFWPESADFGLERAILGPERGLRGGANFGPQRTDFLPEWADFGLERANLGPERGLGGGTDIRTDVWKFTPVSYRTSALWSCCPKRELSVN